MARGKTFGFELAATDADGIAETAGGVTTGALGAEAIGAATAVAGGASG